MTRFYLLFAFLALAQLAPSTLKAQDTSSASTANLNGVNLRVSPFGAVVGSYTASLDFKIGDHWSFGPTLSYYDVKRDRAQTALDLRGYEGALRLTWFHNGVFTDGIYFAPSAGYVNYRGSYTDSNSVTRDQSTQGASLGALVGYGWFWSHFNIMLGLGIKGRFGANELVVTDSAGVQHSTSSTLTSPDGEFSFGWAF